MIDDFDSCHLNFCRSIRVLSNFSFKVNVIKFEVIICTIGAFDNIIGVFLGSFSHISDAKSADVIFTASTHKNRIEIAQTNGTAVLELIMRSIRQIFDILDILFTDIGPYPHLVSNSNLIEHFVKTTFVELLRVISQWR